MPKSFNEHAKDIIKRFLTEDRTRRLGCTKGGGLSVRAHKWFSTLDWHALEDGKGACISFVMLRIPQPHTLACNDNGKYLFCLSHFTYFSL